MSRTVTLLFIVARPVLPHVSARHHPDNGGHKTIVAAAFIAAAAAVTTWITLDKYRIRDCVSAVVDIIFWLSLPCVKFPVPLSFIG